MRRLLFVLVALAGCRDRDAAAPAPAPPPPPRLAGIYPDKWRCDAVAGVEAVGQALGGSARPLESADHLPTGLAQPCKYELTAAAGGVESWMFDVDCRPGMKTRADALFAQYEADSRDQVERFRHAAEAGIKPTDAGVPIRAPELAAEVPVGAKGLDHHGRGLVFIDDDAPCYVRVIGGDAPRRLALATLIARNLTPMNAPMTPRPAP